MLPELSPETFEDQKTLGFKNRIHELGTKLGRLVAIGLLISGSGVVSISVEEGMNPSAVYAEDLGYPDAGMPCEHAPYNVTGSCANYDWGPKHTETYDDPSEYSDRGYTYRNCTDYVAWKEISLGATVPKNLGNGGQWYDNSLPAQRSTTPKAWDAAVVPGTSSNPAGHVSFIESVNSDGTITISEYNHDGMGNGDTRRGKASDMGFTEFVDFGVHPSNSSNTTVPDSKKKTDIVVHNGDNTWAVATSTGNSLTGGGIGLSGWGKGDWTGLADVNGDGKSDIVVHNPANASFAVALNNGSGQFYGSGNWLSGWGAGDWAGLADVNGDKKADLVVHNPANNSYAVALSTGSSFSGNGNWLWGWGAGDWAGIADINGDNKADLVVHNPSNNSFAVATSNGSSFSGSGNWLSGWGAGDWASLGDVNGDGKSDIVVHNTVNNAWAVAISTGNSFAGSGNGLSFWGKGDWAGLTDVTGDGRADIVVHNPDNASFAVAINNGNNQFYGSGNWLAGWSAGDWAGSANVNSD